jgi:hypothetical protein
MLFYHEGTSHNGFTLSLDAKRAIWFYLKGPPGGDKTGHSPNKKWRAVNVKASWGEAINKSVSPCHLLRSPKPRFRRLVNRGTGTLL